MYFSVSGLNYHNCYQIKKNFIHYLLNIFLEYFFRILNGILRIDMQRKQTKGQQDKITFNNGYLDLDSHTPNLEKIAYFK